MKFKELIAEADKYIIVGYTTADGKKYDKSVVDLNTGEVKMYDKFMKNPDKSFYVTKAEGEKLIKGTNHKVELVKV